MIKRVKNQKNTSKYTKCPLACSIAANKPKEKIQQFYTTMYYMLRLLNFLEQNLIKIAQEYQKKKIQIYIQFIHVSHRIHCITKLYTYPILLF